MNETIKKWFDSHAADVIKLSDSLWDHPETAMNEQHSCAETTEFMRSQGFTVKAFNLLSGKPEEANCLIATYGSGKPVIGILGEFDALPNLGQDRVTTRTPKESPGHGCGHNLMASGCAGAASALKLAMETEKLSGTLIYYGCPAEETLEGKVHMSKQGLFDKLDICLAWHPGPVALSVLENSMQSSTALKFNFRGKTAHAAVNPDQGRSALDAAELMNVGIQYLREHVSSDVRIHYIYTHGGVAPNVVPDYAQLYYYVRAQSRSMNDEVLKRVIDVSEGAAKMTGTSTDYELLAGCYDVFINHRLNKLCQEALLKIPPIEYSDENKKFAAEVYRNATGKEPVTELLDTAVPPLTGIVRPMTGSSDVGDVTHILPTTQFMGAGMIGGLPFHHWAVTACTGTEIGHKAELQAGKALAQAGYDAFKNPAAIEEAWEEFRNARKAMDAYKPVLP
ncbi:amidohydrolase [Treponema primitia ZAS-2]|uniref:Amidohydrolase n=1 Tax=Treponema primitia (strain ATCC BAA-887 / DSM 12427 / ZAS-2) TaxID=545694 RepID=F5YPL4_TREPZ|nr:amidohydrolase [Treponema primitia]AEF85283.1 amidohydrolase [Treponema primitia ZAS-2]